MNVDNDQSWFEIVYKDSLTIERPYMAKKPLLLLPAVLWVVTAFGNYKT